MYVRRYLDLFDDNTITKPLVSSPGNGSIVESGTSIALTAAAAVDCQWGVSLANAPVAYNPYVSAFPDATIDDGSQGGRELTLMQWETRLIGATFTPVDDVPRGGLVVWGDYENAYQLAYDFSSEYVVWQRIVNNVQTSIADTGGNTVDPNVTPKRLRMVFNPRQKTVTVHGQSLTPNQIMALYSEDDGVTWTYLAKETMAIDRGRLGAAVFLKRSVASPTSTAVATFDYLEYGDWYLTKDDHETAQFEDDLRIPTSGGPDKHGDTLARGTGQQLVGPIDQPPGDLNIGPIPRGAFEDGPLDLFPTSGPTQHQSPEMSQGRLSVGVHVPASTGQPVERPTTPQPKGAFEDGLTFPSDSGPTSHTTQLREGQFVSTDYPELQEGGVVKQRRLAIEDRMFVQLGGPPMDYPKDGLDGDGNNFLGDYQARYIDRYVPADDAWGAARSPGDGFYGAARDGQFYHNGSVCGFGDFGTVGGGIRKTSWGYSNNDPLSHGSAPNWTVSVPSDSEIRFNTAGTTNEDAKASSAHRWYLEGDFDIEVEWYDYAMNLAGASDGGAFFDIQSDTYHRAYVRRRTPGSDRIDSDVRLNGTWSNYAQAPTSVINGGFRFTRTGGTLRRYYDIGGGWVQIGTDQTFGTDRVFVTVGFGSTGVVTTCDVKFRNLQLNSGVNSNKVGWAVEPFGSHRGNRDDFPENAIIATTDSSLDIIDADNNLLWMRFVRGPNSILFEWASNTRPRRVAMKEGVLLVALSNQTTEGGLLRIDFNLDEARVHREEASSFTGALYTTAHGAPNWGRDVAPGVLLGRNSDYAWGSDFNLWRLQSYETQGVAAWYDGGYEYRAAAGDGASLYKWRRWYYLGPSPDDPDIPFWAWSNETNRMYWCYFRASGEFLYLDDNNVYGVDKATYELRLSGGFGGVFPADRLKVLPGTRDYDVQKVLVPQGTDRFYLPANEGVYQIDWPIGSFLHQFGPPSSGATHEIIPLGASVIDVSVGDDGGNDILVLTLYYKDTGQDQMMAIDIGSNTVHSVTPLVSGNVQYAESAV